jgi:hypothetical protein
MWLQCGVQAIKNMMSVILVAALLILLLGAAAVFFLARFRAARFRAIPGRSELLRLAALTTGLALVLWLVGARRLPLQMTVIPEIGGLGLPLWELVVDEVAWQFSFWLLLTGFIAFALAAYLGRSEGDAEAAGEIVALLLVGLGTALLALWAGSLSSLSLGWALATLPWVFLLWRSGHGLEQPGSLLARAVFLLIAQLCLMLTSANAVNVGGSGLDMSAWPVPATSWVLLAAVIQMGVFPLHWWRPLRQRLAWPAAPFIHLLPAALGALLLMRLVMTGPTGTGYTLFLTGFGLLGLLYAAGLAWMHNDRPEMVVAALTLAQVSLIMLVATWAGPEPVLAEVRVLLLAIAALFATNQWSRARPAWLFAGPAVAVAALIGLPLTVGFTGRLALYSAWLAEGRFILVLVASLIYVPIVAAILLIQWPRFRAGRAMKESRSWSLAGEVAAWLLLVLGLVAWPDLSPLADQPLAVVFILLAFAGSIVLYRYVGPVREVQQAMRHSLQVGPSVQRATRATITALLSAGTAFRQAAAILEGEGGLLWLLLLLAILWLAQSF